MSEKTIKNWKALAEYDFETAAVMLETGRYLYVAFMCQQCIEKILKGIYVAEFHKTPPCTHSLVRLIDELSGHIVVSDSQRRICEELSYYYIESRYAEQIQELTRIATPEKAGEIYSLTKGFFECLRNKI
jgi:HEPN domain-containing protein